MHNGVSESLLDLSSLVGRMKNASESFVQAIACLLGEGKADAFCSLTNELVVVCAICARGVIRAAST